MKTFKAFLLELSEKESDSEYNPKDDQRHDPLYVDSANKK